MKSNMDLLENIQKKIGFDLLCARLSKSLKPQNDISSIDKKSGKTLLETAGYSFSRERDLDLYSRQTGENPEVIVLDGGLSLYNCSVDEVLVRKSPKISEMLKFRNIKKILNDSDVVKFRKEETIIYLRKNFIESMDLKPGSNEVVKIFEKAVIELEAKVFDDFFKTFLCICEIGGFVYTKPLPKDSLTELFIFSKKNGLRININAALVDLRKEEFLFFNDDIQEKDRNKYIKDIISGEKKEEFKNREALLKIKDLVLINESYNPVETNLFLKAVPEKIEI